MNVIILVRLGETVAPRRPEEEASSDEGVEEVEEAEEGDTGETPEEELDDADASLAALAAAAAASTMPLSTALSRGCSDGDARVAIRGNRLRGRALAGAEDAVKAMMVVRSFRRQRCDELVLGIAESTTLGAVVALCAAPIVDAALGLEAVKHALARIVEPGFLVTRGVVVV